MPPVSWIKAKVCAWAEQKPEISRVWLFGSVAKGTSHEGSDIDLAVLVDEFELGRQSPATYRMFEKEPMTEQLAGILNQIVQVEFYDPAHSAVIVPAVDEHGIVLYERAAEPANEGT